jgi:hypothetical protein
MNALQSWRTEAKTLGPSPIAFESLSNVVAIGTEFQSREALQAAVNSPSGQRDRSLKGCAAFVRERAHDSS